ncbi:exosome complex component RRP41-like [Corticium candelabrum]|uniref:exosome complex component RRP41-like n=1 Tax=Corticium candelabrum TaxID=121492 RepID=UPI002E25C1A1|nr:exosome complex component RRP41-like [Corticium candelabrum]
MAGIEFLSPEGLRVDGRRSHEIRKVQCKMGVSKHADGSAYVEQGNTKVVASVYGPHEVLSRSKSLHDRALINCQYSIAAFSTGERRFRSKSDRRSLEIGRMIKEAIEAAVLTELAAKSQIDIYVQILQSDGGNMCACINAATLALIDAGIPMRDFMCGCSAGLIEDTPIIDINYLEEGASGPNLSIAVLPRSEKVVLYYMDSRMHVDNLEKVLRAATQGCHDVFGILNRTVREHVDQHIGVLDSTES